MHEAHHEPTQSAPRRAKRPALPPAPQSLLARILPPDRIETDARLVAAMQAEFEVRNDWPGGARLMSTRIGMMPFYRDVTMLECDVRLRNGQEGKVSVVQGEQGAFIVNGGSIQLHTFNLTCEPLLDDPQQAAAYLRFFCTALAGEESIFTIVDGVEQLNWKVAQPEETLRTLRDSMEVAPPERRDGRWAQVVHIVYGQHFFSADMNVLSSGMVLMEDDTQMGQLPVWTERYEGCVRVCG